MENNIPQMKFIAVCTHCFEHNSAPIIELNFRDEAIYYMCNNCKKRNVLFLKQKVATPYPKSRLQR